MSKTMLVNVTHVEESRVAVVDNGVLEAYEIETLNRAQIKGNIYNAVVENVHPSLEAAFIKLTHDQKGFLPLDEVNFHLLPARTDSRKAGRIGQHLHPGQRILAQVVREPFAGKPPTVSTYFSLPGRYLVLMPGVDSSGVSRKIDDSDQRDKLKKILAELSPPEGFGLIARTAGLGQTKAELQRDLRYLLRLWQSIQRSSRATEFPGLVYREADIVIRTIRDHLSSDISEVWIDSQETYDKALEFVGDVMPTRSKVLKLYSGDRPLFNKHNLEEQIESIYKRRVSLPSGGEIVIDGTEALTAIDVNSARSKRKGDAEETALATNLEAAAEIARQFRLRDLGGLIVIDFIDMTAMRNKKKVEDALRAAMRGDRARHDITRISKLGLVEIARQRVRGAKVGAMYTTCPSCDGYGLIKNLEAAALAALRKVQTRVGRGDYGRVRVRLPADVATWMLNNKREDLLQVDKRYRMRVEVVPVPELLRHQVEIETLPREATEAPAARVVGDRMAPPTPPDRLPPPEIERETYPDSASEMQSLGEPPAAGQAGERPLEPVQDRAAEPASGPSSRRRRRRRRRGGSASTEAGAPRTAEADADADPDADEAVGERPHIDAVPSLPQIAVNGGVEAEGGGQEERPEREGPRRRRRRRRRRGRGGAEAASRDGASPPPGSAPEGGSAPDVDENRAAPRGVGSEEEFEVPRAVSSQELMPAAVGESPEQRGPRGRRGGRRRRGSPPPA